MPEEVLFEEERKQDRGAIADYLRTVADKLDGDGPITLSAGENSVSIDPPNRPTFEVKVERETESGGGSEEIGVEFEIEWDVADESGGDGELTIE